MRAAARLRNGGKCHLEERNATVARGSDKRAAVCLSGRVIPATRRERATIEGRRSPPDRDGGEHSDRRQVTAADGGGEHDGGERGGGRKPPRRRSRRCTEQRREHRGAEVQRQQNARAPHGDDGAGARPRSRSMARRRMAAPPGGAAAQPMEVRHTRRRHAVERRERDGQVDAGVDDE